jgi:hypothetical protein
VLDFATNAARSVLGIVGVAEQRGEALAGDVGELREAVAAMHRTAAAVERHVEVLGEVTDALPALTASVTRLCDQLSALLVLATPVEHAEQELRGLRRLFRRRRAPSQPRAALGVVAAASALPPEPPLTPPPSAPADGS